MLLTPILVAFVLTAAGPNGANADSPTPSAPSSDDAAVATIAVKETASKRIAFVDHVGPYWTTGPVVAEAQAMMGKLRETGPLFVEYVDDPHSVAASELRTRIGFVVQGGKDPGDPFRMGRQAAGTVLYLLAPGPVAGTLRHHRELVAWAKANGYEPVGPLRELYWVTSKPFEREVVEIQLGVEKSPEPLEQPAPPDPVGRTETGSAPIAERSYGDPGSPDDPAPGEASDEIALVDPAAEQEAEVGDGDSAGSGNTDDSPDRPISELYRDGEYALIAAAMIPTDGGMTSEHEAWIGELVLRLAALERALQKRANCEPCPRMVSLTEAIRVRFEAAGSGRVPAGPVKSSGSSGPAADELRRGVMREVDRLLGRVAMQAIEAAAAEGELVRISREVARMSGYDNQPVISGD